MITVLAWVFGILVLFVGVLVLAPFVISGRESRLEEAVTPEEADDELLDDISAGRDIPDGDPVVHPLRVLRDEARDGTDLPALSSLDDARWRKQVKP